MARIPIDQARPGQRLTRAAATRTGVVMVQPGTELTAAIIERLRNLGIDSLFVEGEQSAGAKSLDTSLAELDARFAGHEQDPWMMELKAIVARQLGSPAA